MKIKVLFVCLGNICRSPLAEGIFKHMVKLRNLTSYIQADSAGTASYHIGEPPYYLSLQVAENHGIRLEHRAQQLKRQHLDEYDYILVMDEMNLRDVLRLAGKASYKAKIMKMRQFDDQQSSQDVEDPYGYKLPIFEACYQILHESCANFLDYLIQKHSLGS
ncbi:MAG: low molecular weight phosphotyrosine protein phosphatase [Cytophagales bacterium]|nr:low molecular weight phosphotyrosine protein phosphatase [Cytophagales bacterium]MDW8384936.1 low molecular weight protein-tyrosine-phosphatase [Flammeovirgaceae bacterium]